VRQLAARAGEFESRGIALVRVFHSPVESLGHYANLPFPVLADPKRVAYRQYGVGRGWLRLFMPDAWRLGREARRSGFAPRWRDALAHGAFGRPADFAIGADGRVEHARYGAHFADSAPIAELVCWIDH
jgi:hypothetical protein